MPRQRRAKPTAVDDLGWLFNAAESEMGARSNFPSALLALAGKERPCVDTRGHPIALPWAAEDSAIAAIDAQRHVSRPAAAARLNRIMARYARLPRWAKVVLEAAYEARQLPLGLRGEPGQGQWALVLRLTSPGAQRRRRRVFAIKAQQEAIGLLERALAAYGAA